MLLQTNSETHEKVFCLEIVWGSPWQARLSLDVNSGPIFQSSVDIVCPKDLFIRSNEKKIASKFDSKFLHVMANLPKEPQKIFEIFPIVAFLSNHVVSENCFGGPWLAKLFINISSSQAHKMLFVYPKTKTCTK
jgi:hypothetical protein